MSIDERPFGGAFGEAVEAWLLEHGGYLESLPSNFDPELGLDPVELFAFIEATQPNEWELLVGRHGGDADAAWQDFVDRLASDLDTHGTLDVLRNGVSLMLTFQLAFFKRTDGLVSKLSDFYEANRVTVTRRLPYDAASSNTLDMALLVNGIPTVTVELSSSSTNRTIEDAIDRYRSHDPVNVTLSRRALVHFAVDPDRAAMTTRPAGRATRFLPFNLGRAGAAGNPPNPHGHRTAYLWERVLQRDALLDLLARFIRVERPTHRSPAEGAEGREGEAVIFPRFHQWDAVSKLEADTKTRGTGTNHLIQHSAGSGTSDTIAWTAHGLSNLPDSTGREMFDNVVVITDRAALDRQLQETIYPFEHERDLPVELYRDSSQLEAALAGRQERVVATTLQKLPFVLDQIESLPERRYAVIIDAAHFSQAADAADDLRVASSAPEEQELMVAEAVDAGLVAAAEDPVEEALANAVSARGRQPNVSFFAFLATPKARTLEMFGVWNPVERRYEPFHVYSVRQAIEEGFILDVMANYATYRTFWQINKTIAEDPSYAAPKARRAAARFVPPDRYDVAQKAEIMIEHFRAHSAAKIAGKAKAMIVTSSRLHAVRYKQMIDAYVAKQNYTDLRALVAFSGKVIDAEGRDYTEAAMNAFPESQTVERFGTDDYRMLIVAEKFQIGFDQPLLHTMYVDKVLGGRAAVQTLSRLNRIHPFKTDTFALDFRNEPDDIVAAFEPYYGRAVTPLTDPRLLWHTRRSLDGYNVLRPDEIDDTVTILLAMDDPNQHAALYAMLDRARERFRALDDYDRLGFDDALNRFMRTYSFVSQIVSFGDSKLERDYLYCRALAIRLRPETTSERIDLGAEVDLARLRTELTHPGSLSWRG